ncbi:MAG: hypothetical protein QM817_19945 [Archangium sp.]
MLHLVMTIALSQVTPPPPAPASLSGMEQKRAQQKPTADTIQAPVGPPPSAQKLSFAQQAFGLAHSGYRQGNISAEAAATWSLRIYESEKDKEPKAAQMHLDRMIALEKLAKERAQAGSAPMLDVLTVGYFRAQAEIFTGKK